MQDADVRGTGLQSCRAAELHSLFQASLYYTPLFLITLGGGTQQRTVSQGPQTSTCGVTWYCSTKYAIELTAREGWNQKSWDQANRLSPPTLQRWNEVDVSKWPLNSQIRSWLLLNQSMQYSYPHHWSLKKNWLFRIINGDCVSDITSGDFAVSWLLIPTLGCWTSYTKLTNEESQVPFVPPLKGGLPSRATAKPSYCTLCYRSNDFVQISIIHCRSIAVSSLKFAKDSM